MRATFTLPEGPVRVAMTVERPSECGLGRLEVVVSDGVREIERRTLDAADSVHSMVIPITTGRLEVEVEDGGDGPFRDTLILREAIVVRPGN